MQQLQSARANPNRWPCWKNRYLLTIAKREHAAALERHKSKVLTTRHCAHSAVPIHGVDLDRCAVRGAAGYRKKLLQ